MKKRNNSSKNIWDIENAFYLKSHQSRIIKTLSHYEIFKKSISVKGSIVECGVFKGASLSRFLTFRNYFSIKNKKAFGFDVFGAFPKQQFKNDNKFSKRHNKIAGVGSSPETIKNYLKNKKINNFQLIKGRLEKTIPRFLKNRKDFKISFLHLDLDVFQPTYFALNSFYKNVSPKGIILLDDYDSIEGATKAINLFVKKKKLKLDFLKNNKKLKFIIK